jgi:hypothetical protein
VLPLNAFRGFGRLTPPCLVLRRAAAGLSPALCGPPQTATGRPPGLSSMPKCLTARAALMSRSCSVPQLGHLRSPTDNGIFCHASELRIDIDQDADGVGPKLTLNQDAARFLGNLGGDLREPPVNADHDWAPTFGAPGHLVLAPKGNDFAIGSVVNTGAYTMRRIASNKGAHSSPMPEGRGLRTFR